MTSFAHGKQWIEDADFWYGLKLWQRMILLPIYVIYCGYAVLRNRRWVEMKEEYKDAS